jgi:hypothetical protein
MLFLPFLPGAWREAIEFGPTLIMVGCVGVLGILAVVGGIFAIRRNSASMSLGGATSAILSGLLGILTVILVSVSKIEF